MALIDFGTAATIKGGDILPDGGVGLSTSATTNETDLNLYGEDEYGNDDGGSIVPAAHGLVGTPADHPVGGWLTIGVLFLVLMYYRAKGVGGTGAKAHIGIGESLLLTIGVVFWLTLGKWVLGIYKVPGLSEVVEFV
jgi:hypothetical protein